MTMDLRTNGTPLKVEMDSGTLTPPVWMALPCCCLMNNHYYLLLGACPSNTPFLSGQAKRNVVSRPHG